MVYKGHVANGLIVLDDPVKLDDGTCVSIEIAGPSFPIAKARYERFRPLIGAVTGLPEDWSENHDTYLREEHRA